MRIAQVITGSPAGNAGLRVGDILLRARGQDISTSTALQRIMVEDAIGQRMEITVWRNGALLDAIVVPQELAEESRDG